MKRSRRSSQYVLWMVAVGLLQGLGVGCYDPPWAQDRDEPDEPGDAGAGTSTPGTPSRADGWPMGQTSAEGECLDVPAFPGQASCSGEEGGWAEALQKALWFYRAQMSGPGLTCSQVQWRGDAHVSDAVIPLDPVSPNGVDLSAEYIEEYRHILDPEGKGTLDLSGGFYDAGDFVKFGLPQTFAASTLAWSLHEFPQAYEDTGLGPEIRAILGRFADYFLRATFRDEAGEVVAFAYQVGDGQTDHGCGWMPPELRRPEQCPRRAYFASRENPAADQVAGAAAALTLISLVLADTDEALAVGCLDTARALYRFAASAPDPNGTAAGGFYDPEYAEDELAWAAVWLYLATDEWSYIDDIIRRDGQQYTGWLGRIMATVNDDWQNIWTYCWRVVWAGVFVKLAPIVAQAVEAQASGEDAALEREAAKYEEIARWNLEYWSHVPHQNGQDNYIARTPAGLSFLVSWGSGRYNAGAQMTALVYAKTYEREDFAAWARSQSEYLLGDNPLGISYMVGYGESFVEHPHHASSHGSTTGFLDDPPQHRHVLYGALANGPSDENDGHDDTIENFGANEVSIDYNAPFVGALAGLYVRDGQGQCPLSDFPPAEPPGEEFLVQGKINAQGSCTVQVEVALANRTSHPPRYDEQLHLRYFIDLSEVDDSSAVTASIIYDDTAPEQGPPTTLSGPHRCSDDSDVYYFDVDYAGQLFYGDRRTLIEIGVLNGSSCQWDAANDWSFQDLGEELQPTELITAYSGDQRVWGREPPCAATEEPEVLLY